MDILGKPLVQIIKDVESKKYSLKEVYSFFLSRIEKFDSKLNSFVTVLQEFEQPQKKGRLYGAVIGLKDNFCLKGVKTTASSFVLEDFISPYDSTVSRRIKDEGGVIIGKNNLDAWAHGSSTETSDFGPTKNPWNTEHVPGGSSGGSAAAVASYLVPASIGSETAGSIRLPAAWCGIVGLKPTYGRVSRYGLIAMASSLDCPGPLTWYVEDAALLLEVLAGKDEYDATSSTKKPDEYLKHLSLKRKFKIGLPKSYLEVADRETQEKIYSIVKILEKLGHKVEEMNLLDPKYAISVYTIIQRAEVASNLSRYDGIRYGHGREKFGFEAKKRIILGNFVLSHGYFGKYYVKAQKVRKVIINDFERAFRDYDLLLAPVAPGPALKLGEFEKYPFFGEAMDILTEASSVAGLPAISLPAGLSKTGLPIGIQLISSWFKEKDILNLAYNYQNETEFFGMREVILKKYS